MSKTYYFLDAYCYPDCDFHQEIEILKAAGYDFKLGNCRTMEDIVEFAKDAEVIGDVYLPITEELLQQLPNLKGVIRYGIGYDCVDVDACTRHNVWCCNLPTYCLEDVASITVGFILDLTRKLTFFDRSCRRGEWNVGYGYPPHRIGYYTIGLVGFGNIARNTYNMLKAIGANVIAYDPYLPDERFEEFGCRRVDFDTLLAESDIVSIHVPATPETHHLFNDETFAKMKDGAMLVNTARGPIVSEEALVKACQSGKLSAAALDVVEKEPITDVNHRLYQCDNIIVTPHVAYNTIEASDAQHIQASETAVTILNGETPFNRVNLR